ncbi:NAD(P)-dependent alcohol dehydrogenase [Actinophytocola sediminis]
MKAIVQDSYGETEVLSMAEVPDPTPARGEVLVRVHAAGVDPGVWHFMAGLPYPIRAAIGLRAPRIRVRGRDVAGEVVAVGPEVTEFAPGDAVFGATTHGSYAELARVPVRTCVAKPANLSYTQAAALPVSGLTALQAVGDLVRPGHTVAVLGAGGGVGSYAVQLAAARGGEVTGVCSAGKHDLVRSIGATHVVDYTTTSLADSGRYDLVIDTAGLRTLAELRRALTPAGTLVIVGGEGGGRWSAGLGRGLVAALRSPFTRQRLTAMFSKETKEGLTRLARLTEAGELTPVIDRTFPLAETPAAIRYLMAGHARGKVVVSVLAD